MAEQPDWALRLAQAPARGSMAEKLDRACGCCDSNGPRPGSHCEMATYRKRIAELEAEHDALCEMAVALSMVYAIATRALAEPTHKSAPVLSFRFSEAAVAKPLKGIDDAFYGIHGGDNVKPNGASLRWTQIHAAAALLERLKAAYPEVENG